LAKGNRRATTKRTDPVRVGIFGTNDKNTCLNGELGVLVVVGGFGAIGEDGEVIGPNAETVPGCDTDEKEVKVDCTAAGLDAEVEDKPI